MKRICAWCGSDLGSVPSPVGDQERITHGLCEDCAHHLSAQMGMPLRQYLEGLGAPVLVVDGEVTVQAANGQALAVLRKERAAIEGRKQGEVFECAHAKLPEGCGRTIHCSGCTIRRTVTDTFTTGRSHLRVPACLNHECGEGAEEVQLVISTERVDGLVLLRVDALNGAELWEQPAAG